MHLKATNAINNSNNKSMASLKDDEQQSPSPTGAAAASATTTSTTSTSDSAKRSTTNSKKLSPSSSNTANNSINNNNNSDNELKVKKETLEARKLELERMLSEKSWLLQQIQKQETQIMNGNYEYLTLNEFFANLAQQYKQEQAMAKSNNNNSTAGGNNTPDSAILRRKQSNAAAASKENQGLNTNNNRNSELSNRSSEYDNYQPNTMEANLTIGVQQQQQQSGQTIKSSLKKRATPTPQAAVNYLQRQQQQQQMLLQQHIELYPYPPPPPPPITQSTQVTGVGTHLHYPQQRTAMYAPQSPQQSPLQTHNHHHHLQHQHQHQTQPQVATQFDGISLYSVNSASVATLRQQHVAPQQQPIIVQCDKYYLSPTHQSYNEGGFIKSSQNIKKYISPLASPTTHHYEMPHPTAAATAHHQHQQHLRQLDAISLAPSYVSMDAESIHQLRWRSQTHIGPLTPPHQSGSNTSNAASSGNMENATKAHSSDMLAHISNSSGSSQPHGHQHFVNAIAHSPLLPPAPPPPVTKTKPLDEISHSTLNLNTDKKTAKPKQWLESSLDGPVMRSMDSPITTAAGSTKQPRERAKLSSQSMSASGGRHYSMSSARNGGTSAAAQHAAVNALNTSGLPSNGKLLQHDDGRYAKLSQSTSYLNSMEHANSIGISASYPLEPLDIPLFRQLPPKPNSGTARHQQQPTPPPRPPPAVDKSTPAPLTSPPVVAVTAASLSPDIRIESPKNMTVVQQATFQPYKEVTKPFEMSDFYKYSTKFKQKEQASNAVRQATPTHLDGN